MKPYPFSLVLAAFTVAAPSVYADDASQPVESVHVFADRVVQRNHVDSPSPKLVYDSAFFQRFEPISVGDMLKRVPGVSFTSDVGEYDLPRLRGLDSKYTQVLINGRKLPGEENDGAIAVDRIPAEMVEKIEILRSPTSDIDSEGIGGTLNIVLKEGARYQGGIWRLGAVHMEETDGSGFIGFTGMGETLEYNVSANIQERHNPKSKVASKLDGDEREDVVESDVRDSRDVSVAGDAIVHLSDRAKLGFNLFYMDTERDEEENTRKNVFLRADSNSPFVLDEQTLENQLEKIEQSNTNLGVNYDLALARGELNLYAYSNQFEQDKTETNREADLGDPLELDEIEVTDIDDSDTRVGVAWKVDGESMTSKFGAEVSRREREFSVYVADDSGVVDDEDDEFADFRATIDGYDLYATSKMTLNPKWEVEAGVRAEYRDQQVEGRDFAGAKTDSDRDNWEYNPSVHLRWHFSEQDQFRASVARTLRYPQFDQLNPVELTIDDEKFRGNPELDPESAWGLDIGYDHFIGNAGVVGVNVFYREVSDLIEYQQTEITVGVDDFDLREPINNRNDGSIMGVEVDVSTPFTAFGLPNLQGFLNYTLLDSEVEDPYFEGVERRFSGQAEYVYNIGFEHEIESMAFSYGMSYQRQGAAEEFEGGEVNRITYDGNLEVFIEKRFASGDYVVRLSGQNLLDAEKRELIKEYDDSAAYRADNFDTREVEVEETSPSVILTFRGRF